MKKFSQLSVFLLYLVLSGCVTNYQYMAEGDVTTMAGEKRHAVMYWHKDEGRLWYGKKYEQMDTSLTVRICQEVGKLFSLSDIGLFELPSKSGDIRVARIDDNGLLLQLPEAEPLREGNRCGLILAEGKPAVASNLNTGVRPAVSILCTNGSRPERYPVVAIYPFNAVSRQVTRADRQAPDPCLNQ